MEIRTLDTCDLFSYASLHMNLANLGCVLIDGPIGAGKSTIFKSISWTLFGNPLNAQKADEVIRLDRNQKQVTGKTYGRVLLNIDGKEVEVRRHRKHKTEKNKLLLSIDGHDATQATDAETQKVINQTLGLDFLAFSSCVLYPQAASGFAAATDSDQKSVLDSILQMERFGIARDRVRKDIKEAANKVADAKHNLELAQIRIADQQRVLVDQLNKEREFEADRERRLNQAIEWLHQLQSQKPTLDPALYQRLQELEENAKAYTQALSVCQQIEAAITSLQRTINDKKEARATKRGELASLQEAKLVLLDSPPTKPEFGADFYRESISRAERDMNLAAFNIGKTSMEVEDLQKRIERKNSTDVCDRCKQPLPKEVKDRLFGSLEEDLKILQMRLDAHTKARDAHKQIVADTKRCLEEAIQWDNWLVIQEKLKTLEEKSHEVEQFDKEISALEAAVVSQQSILAQARQIASAASEAHTQSQTLRQAIAAQEQRQAAYERDKAFVEEQRDKIAAEVFPFASLIEKTRQEIAQHQANRDRMGCKLQDLTNQLSYLEFWDVGYGNGGVKSLLLDISVPTLTERANEYLRELTDNAATVTFSTQKQLTSGEMREKLSVEVAFLDGCNNYRGLSGGETRLSDIAVMLSLGDLAASRSRAPVKIRMLDEIFDGLATTANKEKVVRLLYQMVLPRVGTLLVMSHDEELKSLFTRRFVVAKTGEGSIIEYTG